VIFGGGGTAPARRLPADPDDLRRPV